MPINPPYLSGAWRPGQVERRLSDGTFECMNPCDISDDALNLQKALLRKGEIGKNPHWVKYPLLCFVITLIWWYLS